MRQHLLRVTRGADAFASLIRALGAAGERAGWLELAAPSCLPEELESAAGQGVLRAVAVGGGRSVAVKPLKGEPVLRDLLREHFRGSLLVLVKGHLPGSGLTPSLEPQGEEWLVVAQEGASRRMTTEQLIAALRRTHPWNATESAAPAAPKRRT